MKRSKTRTISDIVREYMKVNKIDRKLKELGVARNWKELLGENIAEATKKVYLQNGILYVTLNSSVIRNELFMLKQGIIDALNKKAGEPLVKDIMMR